ncbi:MAG: AAA family ATPase [Acidobacteriota bacterium]
MSETEHLYSTLRPSLRGVTPKQFAEALEGLDNALSMAPGPRTQLTIRRLRFDGEKQGDFRFFPGVNIIRAGNDKGKSSVLKMIHFCLTGRNDLKKDVDSWIHRVELFFELDGEPHAIVVRKGRRPSGRLLRCDPSAPEDLDAAEALLEFKSGRAMQQTLEGFFNRAFGLRPLMGTQKDSRKGSDKLLDAPTSYRAYVRGMYINQDMGYTDLVTDGIPYGNLFMKIVGMLLGVRGIDAFFAVEARLAHVENLLAKEERYHRRLEESFGLRDLASLDEEIGKLERYIDELKVERTALFVRATSNDLDQRLAELTERLVGLDEAKQRTAGALREAEMELRASEDDAAQLESALLAQGVLAPVAADHWPVYGIELTAEQRTQIQGEEARRGAELKAAAEGRLVRVRRAIQAQRGTVEGRRSELQEMEFHADQVAQQKRHLQAQLRSAHQGTAEMDREIELETRYLGRLEAERESATRLVSKDGGSADMKRLLRTKTILDTVLRYLRTLDADVNERRKQGFARRVQEYCTTIGFPGLEDLTLDAQLKPRISQNGKVYTFDELSPGEKVRFVLAFYLALAITTAEDLDNGAHPGLLLIDSPGKEEMVAGDFEAVVSLLSQIELQHSSSIQVLVATSIPAIRGATQVSKQYFIANDEEPMFG